MGGKARQRPTHLSHLGSCYLSNRDLFLNLAEYFSAMFLPVCVLAGWFDGMFQLKLLTGSTNLGLRSRIESI